MDTSKDTRVQTHKRTDRTTETDRATLTLTNRHAYRRIHKRKDKASANIRYDIDIQSWTFTYIRLLNKPYVNGVTLREQKRSLKSCQSLELLIQI